MENTVYLLWLLVMGALIFLMQAGFFLLEGGQVRARDVSNVLMKMMAHTGVGIPVFFVAGFAIKQWGWPVVTGLTATTPFLRSGNDSLAFYVSLMFALVSCAIPSGSLSSRMKFSAYVLFAVLYVGLVYPVYAYFLWNGPLARLGVQDYAGSLGVHAVGGIVGLAGAAFLGPRVARAQAHDVPMMGFGAMLLMFCWFGFNLGSVPSAAAMPVDLPLVAINTLMAMSGGIVGSMIVTWMRGRPSALMTPNGGLAGAVAICSGVHLVHPLFGFLVGAVAGAQIPFTSRWLAERLRIDDPCDVGPVHALPGLLGGVAAGVWALMIPNGFHGYTLHMGAQILAAAAALVYAAAAGVATFWLIDRTLGLRVTAQEEMLGLDVAQHAVQSYPEFMPRLPFDAPADPSAPAGSAVAPPQSPALQPV
jgi:ammonium transporter, Amt family